MCARRYDDSGPQLFQVDPSGAYFGWRASAIGKNFVDAKTFLEKVRSQPLRVAWVASCWGAAARSTRRSPPRVACLPVSPNHTYPLPPLPPPPHPIPSHAQRYAEDMELEDAVHTSLLTLREGFEGEMTANNIELAVVGADRKFRVLTASEVADYLAEAD